MHGNRKPIQLLKSLNYTIIRHIAERFATASENSHGKRFGMRLRNRIGGGKIKWSILSLRNTLQYYRSFFPPFIQIYLIESVRAI